MSSLNQRTTSVYDAAGQSVASIDPLNRRSSTVYDLAGRTLVAIDPLTRRTTSVYDAAGQGIASIDPLSRRSSTVYDLAGRSVVTVNPLNQRSSTAYDAAGQTIARVDPLNRRSSTVYDLAGRSRVSINPLNQRTTSVYDAAGQGIASIDPLNRRSSTVCDLAGRSVASVNPLNERASTVYDAAGQGVASVDPLMRRSTTVYDLAGRTLATVNPLRQRNSTVYDAAGQGVASIDPLNRRSSTVYDLAGRSVASVNPLNERTTSVYDAAGQSIASIDPLNRRSSTVYDLASRALATVNPLRQRTTSVYDAAGQSVATIDPLSRRNSTLYDLAGRALATVNPLNQRSSTVYDAAGQSVASVDPLNRRNSTVYDLAGRTRASINALGQRTTTVSDNAGQGIASIDPLLRRNSTVYDLAGRSVASINPLSQRSTTAYDAAGQGVARIDPLARRSTTVYDLAGRALVRVNPLNERTTSVYDDAGQSVASVDPLERRSSTVYDLAGRTLATVNPLNQRNSTVYDAAGQARAAVDPLGGRTSYAYDLASRTVATIDPLNARNSTVYDAAGQGIASIDPLNRRSSTIYDLASRSITNVNPLAERTTTVYDAAGQSVARHDPLNRRSSTIYDFAGRSIAAVNPLSERSSTVYDAAGQSVATLDPRGGRVSSIYDLAGRRTRLTDPNTHSTTFAFDAAGQQTAQVDPLLRRTTFGYDLASRRTLVLDPRSLRVSFVYDAAGQRTLELLPAGQRTTFAYDLASRRTLLVDVTGRTSTVYDAKGRTMTVAQPGGKRVSYAYDAADRRRYLTDPDNGRTTYVHDPAGQLTLVNAPSVGRTTMSYDAAGRLLARLPANAARVSHAYDAAGQLTVLATTRLDGTTVNRFSYTYDGASRRSLALESNGARNTYGYDPSGQLTREWRTGTNSAHATFTYDPAGNRLVLIDSGQRTTSTYDAANQLLVEATPTVRTTYAYDDAGNRSEKEDLASVTFYGWDAHSRLTEVETVAGPIVYQYDGDGRRNRRETSSEVRRFVYDFEKVLQEADDDGVTQKQYASTEEVYGDLLSAFDGGQARYFAYDGLGSTDALLAPDGSAPDRYAYRAFGLETHTQGTDDNRFSWVGKQGYYDDRESGLYFLRARYYDPQAGRFLSNDPDGFGAGDANLYRYTGNDPVNLTDPSGKAVLVPADDVKRLACGLRVSFSTDILRDQIYETYHTWNPRDAVTISFDAGVNRNERVYSRANLYKSLPPETWGKIESKDGGALAAKLHHHLGTALTKDQVIRPAGWFDWNPDRVPGSMEALAYDEPAGRPVLIGLASFVDQVGGVAQAAGGAVLATVQPLAQVGLAALTDLAGVKLQDLLDWLPKITQGGGGIQRAADVVLALVRDPIGIATTAAPELKKGFLSFFGTAADNFAAFLKSLTEVFFKWLFGDLSQPKYAQAGVVVPQVPNLGDVWDVGRFLLEVIGLGVDRVLGWVAGAVGAKNLALLLRGYDLIATAVEKGPQGIIELVSGKLATAEKALGSLFDLKALTQLAIEEGTEYAVWVLVPEALIWLGQKLLSFLDPTGISAVVNGVIAVYRTVEFAVVKAQEALEVLAVIGGALESIASRALGQLANKVKELLIAGLKLLVGFLACQVSSSVCKLPSRVAGFFAELQESLETLFAGLIQWVKDVALKPLGLTKPAEKGRYEETLTEPVASEQKKVRVWLARSKSGQVVVMTSASPDKPLSEALKGMTGKEKEAAEKLGNDLVVLGQPLLKASQAAEMAAPAQGSGAPAPAVKRGKGKAAAQRKDGAGSGPKKQTGMLQKGLAEASKKAKEAEGPEKKLADLLEMLMGGACPTGMCFRGRTWTHGSGGEVVRLEAQRVGRRVLTYEGGVEVTASEAWWSDRSRVRLVRLVLDYGGGDGVDVELLRRVEWVWGNAVLAGGVVWLDLPEQGAVGWARVLAVEPCPELEAGPGRLVTGTFRHWRGLVHELHVEGEAEPLGVTPGHPIWSLARGGWVPACELQPGERLLGLGGGTPKVQGWSLSAKPEPVYNIEVDGDHCYRVGQQGLLVHNASFGPGCDPCKDPVHVERETIEGSDLKSSYDYVISGTSVKRRQVCRVWMVEGVFEASKRDEAAYNSARETLRGFFFNKGGKTTPTELQRKYAEKYVAGHLLASSLGGANDTRNFVPMLGRFNDEGRAWSTFEWWVKECLKMAPANGGYVRIKVVYPSRSPSEHEKDPFLSYVPSAFKVELRIPSSGGAGSTGNPPERLFRFTLPHAPEAEFKKPPQSCT